MTVVAPPGMGFMTDAIAHWAAVRPDAEALTYGGCGGRGHSGTTGSGGCNPSGKILKRTLRAPYWAGRDRQI